MRDFSKKDPVPLAQTLELYFKNLGAPPVNVLTQLRNEWDHIVGPGLSAYTRPIELVNAVLVIGCDDSTWASQVQWSQTQIIERFEQRFSPSKVKKIVTKIG